MIGWFARDPVLAQDALAARWAVVDCETTGLDVAADEVIAVGAVAVQEGKMALSQAYAARLRASRRSDPRSIVVHGIGADAQSAGRPPGEVLRELVAFAGDSPVAGFHAPFDRAMLERAAAATGAGRWRARWLDLAALLPVLFADRKAASLDDWLASFGIDCPARHDASADAFVTAQLLLVALAEARRQRFLTVKDVLKAAASARWIS